jgi:hypothetical protein
MHMTDKQLDQLAELIIRQTAAVVYAMTGAPVQGAPDLRLKRADAIRDQGRMIWADITERDQESR